jgi:hypothetical protein
LGGTSGAAVLACVMVTGSGRAAMATRLTLAAATATAETAAPLKNCLLGRGLFMVFMVF